MIKTITSSSPSIKANSYVNMPHIAHGQQSAGMLRYNTQYQRVEVYDGTIWQEMSGYADVGLTGEAENAIQWCLKKMREEAELEQLMQQHPGLRDLHEKFELMRALVTKEKTTV